MQSVVCWCYAGPVHLLVLCITSFSSGVYLDSVGQRAVVDYSQTLNFSINLIVALCIFVELLQLNNGCHTILFQWSTRGLEAYRNVTEYKSYCSTAQFRRITSIYQPTDAHIISHKTLLKHFKTLRHVSILSDHHQGALFLAKVILKYSQFSSYLQTRCYGSKSCCVVEQWLGVRLTTHT